MVAHTCNSRALESQSRRITGDQEFNNDLGNRERPQLYKNQTKKLLGVVVCTCSPSYSGGWGGRITWEQEFRVAVSYDHTIPLQSEWHGETLPIIIILIIIII